MGTRGLTLRILRLLAHCQTGVSGGHIEHCHERHEYCPNVTLAVHSPSYSLSADLATEQSETMLDP